MVGMEFTKPALKGLSKNKLIEIVLQQQSQFKKLEERLARLERNSETSSKPASTDPPKSKRPQSLRKKSGKRPGGQVGHPGKTRQQEPPDEVVKCQPADQCSGCGTCLDIAKSSCVEARQEVEIPPIKAHITEY